uniref:BTB domain-containing protein n=1 Tax=Panagrellus redivivus TaxID=6233 RepID=A0A7E4V195_PANRE
MSTIPDEPTMSDFIPQQPAFADTLVVELDEAITHVRPIDCEIRTPMRPLQNGVSWAVSIYPLGAVKDGYTNDYKHMGVFVLIDRVNVDVEATFSLVNTDYKGSFSHHFGQFVDYGFGTWITHDQLRASGGCQNGRFSIKCDVSVKVCINLEPTTSEVTPPLNPVLPFEFVENSDHDSSDADFFVDGQLIKVHRGYMAMVSPMFQAMFANSEIGIITISDFTYETVKMAVDFLYGQQIVDKTVSEVIDVLRFMKKFTITAAVKRLETWLVDQMAAYNFATIVKHAFDDGSEYLRSECKNFFSLNRDNVIDHVDFQDLQDNVMFEFIQSLLNI